MTAKRPSGGFTIIELLVVIAILGILAAISVPQLLGAREKSRMASCDFLFHTLDGEIANEMDTVIHSDGNDPSCGDMGVPWHDLSVIRCVTSLHTTETNPRNQQQPAFINYLEHPVPFGSCQVGLDENSGAPGDWGLSVRLRQFISPSGSERTFSIKMD